MTYPDPFPSGQLIVADRAIKEEASDSQPKRVIIGQSEIAGLPISAPVEQRARANLRWRKKADSFVLEEVWRGDWQEVPFIP
jgi:hypothetical protein